jgi:sn-glycerol 3-phosphate transport system permease protein
MFIFAFPFYWMVITAFKSSLESQMMPPTMWPQNWTFEAYERIAATGVDMSSFAFNSVFVTASTIILQLVLMIPAAYGFAKREFPLKGILFGIVMIAFMLPGQLTYIPVFLMMSDWGMLNSYWPQIIPHGANAFGIFMLRQAFKQIPDEIIESARMDNAGEWKIMTRIMLPMCTPTMVTIAMFSFIGTWNSYFWPLVMTFDDKYRPLTIMIERLKDMDSGIDYNLIMAGNCVLVVPVLIVFFFASKKIIQSYAYRGMK